MRPDVEVAPFAEGHLREMWRLWEAQYREEVAASGALPATWSSRGEEVEAYLREGTGSKYSAVATIGSRVVGHMLFRVFPFHGEPTAFCPITCHAGQPGMRGEVLETLYRHLAGRLVEDGALSHCITYFAHDGALEEAAFRLGFGMIVVDAFRGTGDVAGARGGAVRQATLADLGVVRSLCDESWGYYRSPPIFLAREKGQPDEYYAKYLGSPDRALFLAMDGDRAVGFMSVRRCGGLNYYDLSDPGTALIDEMGAYIVPGRRGSGLGKALLAECVGWCRRSGIPRIHVDFESANVPARRFWLRHFMETARSVRRSVYRDIVR